MKKSSAEPECVEARQARQLGEMRHLGIKLDNDRIQNQTDPFTNYELCSRSQKTNGELVFLDLKDIR